MCKIITLCRKTVQLLKHIELLSIFRPFGDDVELEGLSEVQNGLYNGLIFLGECKLLHKTAIDLDAGRV